MLVQLPRAGTRTARRGGGARTSRPVSRCLAVSHPRHQRLTRSSHSTLYTICTDVLYRISLASRRATTSPSKIHSNSARRSRTPSSFIVLRQLDEAFCSTSSNRHRGHRRSCSVTAPRSGPSSGTWLRMPVSLVPLAFALADTQPVQSNTPRRDPSW